MFKKIKKQFLDIIRYYSRKGINFVSWLSARNILR
jgi:hypothetical protein